MSRLRFFFSASLLSLLTAWSAAALADVPSPDRCASDAKADSPCNVAGPKNDQPGTCQSSTCSHVGPGPNGGIETRDFACMVCREGPTTPSGVTTPSGSTSSGGGSRCSVGAVGREGAITGTMMLVGLAALLAERRSRGSAGPRPRRRAR